MLSGGFIDSRRSRLKAHADARRLSAELERLDDERHEVRRRASQHTSQLAAARSRLHEAQAAERRASMQLELETLDSHASARTADGAQSPGAGKRVSRVGSSAEQKRAALESLRAAIGAEMGSLAISASLACR